MNSSQHWKWAALWTANVSYRTTAELKIPSGFWNGFTFAYIHYAIGKAQFYEKVIHKIRIYKDLLVILKNQWPNKSMQ